MNYKHADKSTGLTKIRNILPTGYYLISRYEHYMLKHLGTDTDFPNQRRGRSLLCKTNAPAINHRQGPLGNHFALKMDTIRISETLEIHPISTMYNNLEACQRVSQYSTTRI